MKTRLHRGSVVLLLLLVATGGAAEGVTLSHGGLSLSANLETTGANWQKGPVVLMTHGQLAHAGMEIMQTLQAALKERGVSLLSITLSLGIDNRAGMYDCKVPHKHRHNDAIDEIGAWLGWLHSQGVAKAALLGHSRSGNQVARFVLARPDAPVAAVILIAPQIWSADATAQDYEKRYGKPLAAPLARAQQLVAEGKTSKEIASLLKLTVKTAESYRTRIMEKLDIHDTAGLVRYAIRRGIIEP